MPYTNPEDQKAQHKRFYRRNSARIVAKYRTARNKRWHVWAKANPEKLKASRQATRKKTKIQRSYWRAIRRAIQRGKTVSPTHILEYTRLIRAKRSVRCYYCDKKVSGKRAHIDHVRALSRDGTHEVGNLCVSCSGCNLSKHNKPLSEWKKDGQQILPL